MTDGTFQAVNVTGLTRNCINADGTIDNQGGYYGTDVSTPPTAGQAWVWDDAAKRWKPGTIESGFLCSDGVTKKSLTDVAPLLQLFAGCAADQPIKPDGTTAVGMEAIALRSSDFVKTLADGTVVSFDANAIVMLYDTEQDTSGDLTVVVPINQVTVTPNVTIDWGDGTAKETVTAKADVSHTYAKAGRYIVQIAGTVDRFGFNADNAKNVKLTQCLSWGKTGLVSLEGAFRSASKMNASVPTPPAAVTSMAYMFAGCKAFNHSV